MKAYILTTGIIFALITIAHLARMATETHVLTEPLYLLLTIIAAVLTIWAAVLLRRSHR